MPGWDEVDGFMGAQPAVALAGAGAAAAVVAPAGAAAAAAAAAAPAAADAPAAAEAAPAPTTIVVHKATAEFQLDHAFVDEDQLQFAQKRRCR